MTNEEAINIMQVIVHMLEPQYDTDRIEDAVEMAIKALEQQPCPYSTKDGYCQYDDIAETIPTEQEPCDDATLKDIFCMGCEYREQEPCDDAISRDAVIEATHHCGDLQEVRGVVQQLPPVQRTSNADKKHVENTLDDAISRQAVQDYIAKYLSQYLYNDVREAVEVIDEYIGELPSVTPQPCEDAIDRAEAIKIASGYCHPSNVAKELAKLPPVTPQQKIGHWISKPHIYGVAFCSECDFELKINDTNYCPNCGARMQESEVNNGQTNK